MFERCLTVAISNQQWADAALYLVDGLQAIGEGYTFNLNGNAVYYGENNTGPIEIIGGRVARLIKTTYGDFNGDCTINDADLAIFDVFHNAQPNVPNCHPLADSDGDCDVDDADKAVFDANDNPLNTSRCLCGPDDYCTMSEWLTLYPDWELSCPGRRGCPTYVPERVHNPLGTRVINPMPVST